MSSYQGSYIKSLASGSQRYRPDVYASSKSSSKHNHHHHVPGPPSLQKNWHSETNSKGNLVIAKKPPSLAYEKAEKKIWLIVAEYKKDASRDEISQLTKDIMKVCDKYKRGEYGVESRSTTDHARKEHSKKEQPKKEQPKKVSPKARIPPPVLQNSSKRDVPKKTGPSAHNQINQELVKVTASGKKVPNELLRLINSDGFVDTTPKRVKRTPKKVYRFNDSLFKPPSSRKRRSIEHSTDRTDQKKVAAANVFKIPLLSKQTPNTPQGSIGSDAQSTVQRSVTTSQSTTTSSVATTVDRINSTTQTTVTKTKTCNFVHNEVKIFHMPMVEFIKKEKSD